MILARKNLPVEAQQRNHREQQEGADQDVDSRKLAQPLDRRQQEDDARQPQQPNIIAARARGQQQHHRQIAEGHHRARGRADHRRAGIRQRVAHFRRSREIVDAAIGAVEQPRQDPAHADHHRDPVEIAVELPVPAIMPPFVLVGGEQMGDEAADEEGGIAEHDVEHRRAAHRVDRLDRHEISDQQPGGDAEHGYFPGMPEH
jgi:hypothetical protein